MSELVYDMLDPGFLQNPYPHYDRQRAHEPIAFSDRWNLWVISRYEDISNLLRDRRFGRSILHVMTRAELGWPPARPELEPFTELHRHRLLDLEPPDHTRIRTLVAKVFTPQTAEELRPRIQKIAADLLNHGGEKNTFDLLADFAVPLPVTVIAELLGVPESDRPLLHPWSQDIVAMYEFNPTPDQEQRAVRAAIDFPAYLRDLTHHYRRHPAQNLISDLVRVEEQGDRLTEQELIATCVLLLNAGHEATVNTIGNGFLALFRNPDQLALLRQNPARVRSAVEEMMRYDTPLQFFKRWAMEEVHYANFIFKRGDQLGFVYGSGNRDPAKFNEPDRFQVERSDKSHLSFGLGTHFCLGAPLARVELQIAVEALLNRFPRLRLAQEDVRFRSTYVIRGLTALPVAVD